MSFAKDQKNRTKPEKKRKEFTEIEFVNYRLSETQVDDFTLFMTDNPPDVLKMLDEMTTNNYKVSMSVDTENSCYIIAVTGSPLSLNAGRCMTSRSDILYEALAIAFYKLNNIFHWDTWDVPTQRTFWG